MGTGIENLLVYQKSFELAMKIYEKSKCFPKEEKYSLTDQVRRSSRAVCANLAEAYCKRRFEAHFISKLSDADMENTETQVWLSFALYCNYISTKDYQIFNDISKETGRLIGSMLQNPKKFA